MKSLNVKKIAAVAAGAAMLGAAFAGAVQVDSAGVGSYPFFANGAPNVKIVVGSWAQPWDAVAAANIAAMIGNMAYTSKDVTVLGADALSCSGGSAGGANKVSLEVTTPGVNPNVAYSMKTYSGDSSTSTTGYLDFTTTDDRVDSLTGSTSSILAPDGTTGGRKITSYDSPLVWKGTITDNEASKSYTEEERYYVYAKTQYDTAGKVVKAKQLQLAYDAQFTNPIQVCTDATPSLYNSQQATTGCTEAYFTPKHRMKVKLFGSDWVMYQMNNFPTTGSITSGSTQVVMGKEVQFKEFMQIGDEITAPNGIKIRLKDVSVVATGTSQLQSASFELFDANGNSIDSSTLQENGEYNKNGVVIRVFQVFSGIGQTAYAQVNLFSNKLTLTSGSTVDSDNTNWQVTLVGGGTSYGASLSRLQLTRIVVDDLNKGDSVNYLTKPAVMKLSFNGLEPVLYDSLHFNTGQRSFQTSTSDTGTTSISNVQISSSLSTPFNFGTTSTNVWWFDTLSTETGNATQGLVFYQDPTTSLFVPYFGTGAWANVSLNSGGAGTPTLSSSSSGLTYINTSSGSAGIQCASAIANSTAITSATVTVPQALSSMGFSGTPTKSSVAFVNGATAQNLTVQATALNGVTCTSGVNVTLQFAASATGTWSYGGIDSTGIGYSIQNNTVPYQYGSTTRNIVLVTGNIVTGSGSNPVSGLGSIIVPEFTLDTDATTSVGAWLLNVGDSNSGSPKLGPSSGTAYFAYNGSYLPVALSNGTATSSTTYEAGYISPRGSVGESIGLSSATIKYASTLAHALYSLSAASTGTSGNVATTDSAMGDTALDSNGYRVVVKGFTGGSSGSAGTVSGADGLMPSEKKAYVVTPLDTSTRTLTVLDSQASSTEPLIVVGGPLVNSVAAAAMQGAAPMTAGSEAIVKVFGDKLVVAGYTASDTQAAANALIAWMAANKK